MLGAKGGRGGGAPKNGGEWWTKRAWAPLGEEAEVGVGPGSAGRARARTHGHGPLA